jgi:hypothetical protein
MAELVKYLCKPSRKELDKARVLFVWLSALDLSEIDDDDPPEESVREQLLKLHNSEVSYSNVFLQMCK